MSVFKGFIAKIGKKEGRSAKGRAWTLYSIKLEKEDGSELDKWISAGFDPPNAKEGDYVKITAEENDKGYLNASEVKKLKNAPARSKGAAAQGGGGNGSTTQKSIHYQSSRKDAIEVIQLLVANDALPLSAAKTKAGEAKRYQELMALVDKLTIRFFFDAETQRLLDTVVDEGAAKAADVGSLPDDSDEEDDSDDEEEDDSDEDDSDDEDEEDDE